MFVAVYWWRWQRAVDAKMFYDDAETRAKFVDAIAETAPDGKPVFSMDITDDLLIDGRSAQ